MCGSFRRLRADLIAGSVSQMKKWTRRIGLTLVVLVAALGAFVLVSWSLVRGTPDWYEPQVLSESERAEAANRADQKVAETLSWAADVQAAEVRRRLAATRAAVPAGPSVKTISFTEDELNAFFRKWSSKHEWHRAYSTY